MKTKPISEYLDSYVLNKRQRKYTVQPGETIDTGLTRHNGIIRFTLQSSYANIICLFSGTNPPSKIAGFGMHILLSDDSAFMINVIKNENHTICLKGTGENTVNVILEFLSLY